MHIYTLNVGQGQFVVVTGQSEAVIIDSYVPLNANQETEFVKAALTKILAGKKLVGLMVTGFDDDHFNPIGLKLILNKYRPEWIMYPKYFKETANATECFKVIDQFDNAKSIRRHSIILQRNEARLYSQLSENFSFEVFSPHAGDMSSSNNCSLVCKIQEKTSGKSYLVTGDTENERWEGILKAFGSSIQSAVVAASHHGSRNGVSEKLIKVIAPHKVLISAGVKNQYGHPHPEALALYRAHATKVFQTNPGDAGQSLKTYWENGIPVTYLFNSN